MDQGDFGGLVVRRSASACLALLLALGCGGSQPPSAKTPVPEAKEAAREPLEEPIDLSPVPAPKDLVLSGRLARPITVVDTVARWAGLPMSVRQMLPADAKWAEPVVAWDAPILLAGVVDGRQSMPELSAVVSVGLTSVDTAVAGLRDHGMNVRKVSPGIYQVAGEEPSCAIAAARGQAPARLVCGQNFRHVEQLLPYVTRGMPDLPAAKNDLEIEFVAEPLQRLYAQQLSSLTFLSGFVIRELSIDHAGFDRALADAVYGLAGELQVLAVELDRLRIDGKLDEAGNALELGLALQLRADKSWTGQVLNEAAQRSTPAPEAFWQLPDASTGASYANTVSPERMKIIARTLADLADGYLEKEKLGRAARDRVKVAITDILALSAPMVQAQGNSSAPLAKEPTLEQRFEALLGWDLMVAEGPAEPFIRAYRGLHQVVNDRDLRKFVVKETGVDAKLLPTSTEKAFAGKGVPAGGRAFTLTIPPALLDKIGEEGLKQLKAKKDKNTTLRAVMVVVPDGKRTIMALAADEKTAAERVAAFKAGKEPTLAQRPDLGPLRTGKAFAAGFMSLASLAGELSSVAERDRQKLLDGLPHHGQSAILTSVTVDRDKGPTLRIKLRLPRHTIEDTAALGPMLMPKF